jgi:lipopolysaccharide transport system ATP-binding protein
MNAVIKAENLGKKYIIGHQKQRYGDSLRDAMTHTARGIWQRIRHPLSPNRESVDLEELWALRDIDFEVKEGERVGIIGRNGAGKSTLLKILSRITEPTTGKVLIKGRVSSLLEVGTGFHPELTGRENIFLNGAILGMTKQEVKRKFDEIVAFAELEKFLDTPVKRYSSGMYVRLAFAVAAHLEPEILIVDEVLAVGDAQFQKKCLGKMENVAKEGRTVLFVSHNMEAVSALCDRSILLHNGSSYYEGIPSDVISKYRILGDARLDVSIRDREDRKGTGLVRVVGCKISFEPYGESITAIKLGDRVYIQVTLEAMEMVRIFLSLSVKDATERLVFAFNSREGGYAPVVEKGEANVILHIPFMPFLEGTYTISASVVRVEDKVLCDKIENVYSFMVHSKDLWGTGVPFTSYHGVVFVDHQWYKENSTAHLK